MTFLKHLFENIQWISQIGGVFLRKQTALTVAIVLATAVRGIMRLIAFVIPLKVIVLAANSSVPDYLSVFGEEEKYVYITGLALLAIIVYVIAQVLDPILLKWSDRASDDILSQANKLPLDRNSISKMRVAFSDFMRLYAAIVFVFFSSLVLAILNIWLVAWLVIALLLLCLYAMISYRKKIHTSWPAELRNLSSNSIDIWDSLTFFGSFLIILYFLLQWNVESVFYSLLSFILIRRAVNEISTALRVGGRLAYKRAEINAFFSSEEPLIGSVRGSVKLSMESDFSMQRRNDLFSRIFSAETTEDLRVTSRWLDSRPRDIQCYRVRVNRGREKTKFNFDVRIYTINTNYRVEHAGVLLNDDIAAQLPIFQPSFSVKHKNYTVVCTHLGSAELTDRKDFLEIKEDLCMKLLKVVPSACLVESYRKTHQGIFQSLTSAFFGQMSVRVSSDEDQKNFEKWMAILPSIKHRLVSHPLAFVISDLHNNNIAWNQAKDEWQVLYCGAWSLEPIGVALNTYGLDTRATHLIDELKVHRKDLFVSGQETDLLLGLQVAQLRSAVISGEARDAFNLMRIMLERFPECCMDM